MDHPQKKLQQRPSPRTIKQLNEDCELLINTDVGRNLVHYINSIPDSNNMSLNILNGPDLSTEILDLSKLNLSSTTLSYQYPGSFRTPRTTMPPSQSASSACKHNRSMPRMRTGSGQHGLKRSFLEGVPHGIDEPVQATSDKLTIVPRGTMLSRTRQKLCKRNSAVQSADVKQRCAKQQTENCSRTNKGVKVEPLDFLGLYEKGTNCPLGPLTGCTMDKSTQMYEHISQSELFCIEWIHKNLFEVKLNPNTLVVDDKIRDLSESACIT